MSETVTASVILSALGQPSIRQPKFRLKVLKGPSKGQTEVVGAPRFIIGSTNGANIQIKDPTVSALHCEVVCDTAGLRVRDLESKNGVLIDRRRVVEAWLNPKDELQLGESLVRLELMSDTEDRKLSAAKSFGKLVGESAVMRDLFTRLEKAAASDAPVLIVGETGTGKELVADALVQKSPRANKPLVVVDCASLAPSLIESELFGHEKGAFTGALKASAGAFERAHTGTLFLDEIGELPIELQARLLGALERKAVQRVGGGTWIETDVRVLAATHRELPKMVNRGTFRADLYYRIAAITVRLPPLRERPEDIPGLVAHFLAEMPGSPTIPPLSLQQLYDLEYPGNVRELRNCVIRAAAGLDFTPMEASSGGEGESAPASSDVTLSYDVEKAYRAQKDDAMNTYERAYLIALLHACGGNVSEAARRSGLNRVHLYELMRRRRIAH